MSYGLEMASVHSNGQYRIMVVELEALDHTNRVLHCAIDADPTVSGEP